MPVNASHNESKDLPYQFGKSRPFAITVCKSSSDAIFEPSMIKFIWLSAIVMRPIGIMVFCIGVVWTLGRTGQPGKINK